MNKKELLEKYIYYDNYIFEQDNKLKKIKKKREELKNQIIKYLDDNNINKIQFNNNDLCYKENKIYSSINQEFLKKNINLYFQNNHSNIKENIKNKISEDLFNFLIKSRKQEKKITLKRINKNNT